MATFAVTYLFILTAGFSRHSMPLSWPGYSQFYSKLADGFLHHQLSLLDQPNPKMLALADPYEPGQNHLYRYHDAVLYNGKYYVYWGPAPALLAAAICKVFRVRKPTFGDQYLVFAFLMGTMALAGLLIHRIRATFFGRVSPRTEVVALLSLALGPPVLFTLARSAVYEAAIVAGQFFLLAAVHLIWTALRGGKAQWVVMLAAGFCLTLSFASRLSLAPTCAAVALLACWQVRRRLFSAGVMVAPMICGVALLGWYNQARFGSVAEFGLHYQLAGHNQHSPTGEKLSSLYYVPVNLYRYLLAAPQRAPAFPFIAARNVKPWVSKYFRLPRKFVYDPVLGLVWGQPFLIFSAAGLAWPLVRRFRRVAREGAGRDVGEQDVPDRRFFNWLMLTLIPVAFFGIVPAVTLQGSSMRYFLDALPGCTLLAAIGLWVVLSRVASPRAAVWIERAAMFVVAGEILLAIPLGLVGYYGHFAKFNAPLNDYLAGLFRHL